MKKLVVLALALALVLSMAAVSGPAAADAAYPKLTWVTGNSSGVRGEDQDAIEEALNVISREKIGCEVTFLYMTNEQCGVSVNAGEVYDLYFTCDWYNDYATRSHEGIFYDITELLKETPDLYATRQEALWEAVKIDGAIYAVPCLKDYAMEIFYIFDKEFLAEIGMEMPYDVDYCSEDIYTYCQKYVETHPGEYAWQLIGQPGGMDGIFEFVNRTALIGRSCSYAGDAEKENTLYWVFDDEEYIKRVKFMNRLYEAGFINPDAATATTVNDKLHALKTGQGFYGADSIWSSSYGYATQIARVSGPYMSQSSVFGSMNAISAALEPERALLALKYLELVNTDKTYADILRYGIEGVHFNYNEDGTVTRTEAGNDSNKYSVWQFGQGSYALSSVEANASGVSVDPLMWDKVINEFYAKELVASNLIGYTFNPENVEMQVSAVSTVNDKYYKLLTTGTNAYDELIDTYRSEVDAAGMQDILKEAQAQLDAWLASK